jgi:hypothetical protein
VTTETAAREIAGRALRCAVREDWPGAVRALKQLDAGFGAGGMSVAFAGWCDTLISKQRELGIARPGAARPLWVNTGTGEVGSADDVPAEVRWAGQLIAARAAWDEDAYTALARAVPRTPEAVTAHVATLLECVSGTLRGLGWGQA